MTSLYVTRDDVFPQHKDLYYDDLNQHLKAETTYQGLQLQLTTWKPFLWDSMERVTKLGMNRVRAVTQYFTVYPEELEEKLNIYFITISNSKQYSS